MSHSAKTNPGTLTARFARSETAGVAIEFAITAAPLMLLIVCILQIFIIQISQAALETTAEYAARQILTGNAQVKGLTQADFKNLVCGALPSFLNCKSIMIDVQDASSFSSANTSLPTITYDNAGNVTNLWLYQPGAPAQIVVLRLMYLLPVVNLPGITLGDQPKNTLLLMATSVFKNETYD